MVSVGQRRQEATESLVRMPSPALHLRLEVGDARKVAGLAYPYGHAGRVPGSSMGRPIKGGGAGRANGARPLAEVA